MGSWTGADSGVDSVGSWTEADSGVDSVAPGLDGLWIGLGGLLD